MVREDLAQAVQSSRDGSFRYLSEQGDEQNITGNIIPTIWYRTVLKENGKPYLLAIAILSDIVYWYRRPKCATSTRDR